MVEVAHDEFGGVWGNEFKFVQRIFDVFCGCRCICSEVDVNQDEKQLWEFPGKVEGTQGDSQKFDVRVTQFFSDNNCFAPARIDIEADTTAELFTSQLSVSVQPYRGPKAIYVQAVTVIIPIQPCFSKSKN